MIGDIYSQVEIEAQVAEAKGAPIPLTLGLSRRLRHVENVQEATLFACGALLVLNIVTLYYAFR